MSRADFPCSGNRVSLTGTESGGLLVKTGEQRVGRQGGGITDRHVDDAMTRSSHDLFIEGHQGTREAHDAQHHTDGDSEQPVDPIQNRLIMVCIISGKNTKSEPKGRL